MADDVAKFVQGLPQDPAIIIKLRSQLATKDPEAWNGAVRLNLERTLDRALKATQAGEANAAMVAGRLRQQLIGTPKQRATLQAALGKDYGAAQDIFDALELISKDLRANSQTFNKGQVAKEISEKATPSAVSAAQAAVTVANPLEWRNALVAWDNSARTGDAAKAIAGALTDPEKVIQLRQLRRITDPQARVMRLMAVLGVTGTPAVYSAAAQAPNQSQPQ